MGEWYYYNVYFNDQDQHLVSRLCRDGYAEVVCNRDTNGREDQTIKLFLDKIDLATKDNPEIKRRVEKARKAMNSMRSKMGTTQEIIIVLSPEIGLIG